jgi:hypothetical protein
MRDGCNRLDVGLIAGRARSHRRPILIDRSPEQRSLEASRSYGCVIASHLFRADTAHWP